MRQSLVAAVLVALAVGVGGASARSATPADEAIAFLKKAEAAERLALSRYEAGAYTRGDAALAPSAGLLKQARAQLEHGQAAGSVGTGITPSAVRAALDDIRGAGLDDLLTRGESEDAERIASGAAKAPSGWTKEEWEQHLVSAATDNLASGLRKKADAIARLQPAPAQKGSCSNFIAKGIASGQVGFSTVTFDCTVPKSTATTSQYPELIITLAEPPGSHPELLEGGLAAHAVCGGDRRASATNSVSCTVQSGIVGTFGYLMGWYDDLSSTFQGTQTGPTCGMKIEITVKLAEISAATAKQVGAAKSIAYQVLTAAC